ncbi:zinc metallochaperone AztD [Zafaria sp. Z1313]|uniref:zinc metallochaperone AztD n=1 Tax=Zafaria sp. Z1313 TaxID=3423202 RepID=UPI003D301C83
MTSLTHPPAHRPLLAAAVLAGALALSACGGPTTSGAAPASSSPAGTHHDDHDHEDAHETHESGRANPRLAVTYEGGLLVLDANSGEVLADEPLEGFNRVNPAGDGRHVLVSTSAGFRALDTGAWSEPHGDHDHHYTSAPRLTEHVFPATTPGHVVLHADKTVLFDDGTGEVAVFDPHGLADGFPDADRFQTPVAHHGVAVQLGDGALLTTHGPAGERNGITAYGPAGSDGTRPELAVNTDCPGIHGEAVAADEAVVFGCEDGLLVYRNGKIAKVAAPDAYGRIGNQAGSEASTVVLGDYKSDPDAELERPTRVSLTDTESGELSLVETGAAYSFRSLARGPEGEALVLGADGALRVIDPDTTEVVDEIPVTDAWEEPLEWQQPRPGIFVQGTTAYVTEPATRTLHLVDLVGRSVLKGVELPQVPNEITGIPG